MSLAYEVTAEMAADIHTKSFKDSVSWTHACQLINIFPPDQIGSQDIMDLMRPTHSQSTDEKGQRLYTFKSEVPCFPYTQTPYCRRCFIVRVLRVKKVIVWRGTTVWTPSWLSSFCSCCGIRHPRCRRDATCALPGFFAKVCGVRWRTELSFLTRRLSLIAMWSGLSSSIMQYGLHSLRRRWSRTSSRPPSSVPVPYGRQFVRALAPEWRSVFAALARAIHGGYQGFTYRISYLGSMAWTRIIEEVWEDMSQKMRELEGYGKAIVPHVTEFQDYGPRHRVL